MNARTVALGTGTAMTTFLVAGAVTIEFIGVGEAPGIGLIGVFVGIVSGLLAGVIVSVYAARLSRITASVLVAYATFGVAFVAIAGMRYVNLPYADTVSTFPVHLGVSVIAAVVVALLIVRRRRGNRTTPADDRRSNQT
jgi:ABC-type lipoprotein release transport system permease subunit